jgi:hypothetical protein
MSRWAGVWATTMVNVIFKVESHDGRMYHGVGLHGQAVRTEAITPLTVEDNTFMEDHYAVDSEQTRTDRDGG